MQGHRTLILCDVCGREVADASSKEVVYQLDGMRYRLELCPNCLDDEMQRHRGHRGIPGFRKRAAVVINVSSADDLPRRVFR